MVRRARTGPERITVDVETLVLDGVPAGQRARVVAVFERELARLLRERGPGEISRPVARPAPELPAGGTPDRLGLALARSVHVALTAPGPGPGLADSPAPRTTRPAAERGQP